jgi:hypothetical protein
MNVSIYAPYNEIIEFLSSGASPEAIASFHPSTKMQERVEFLLIKEKDSGLTPEEKLELDHYFVLEHIMRMAKIHARRRLAA